MMRLTLRRSMLSSRAIVRGLYRRCARPVASAPCPVLRHWGWYVVFRDRQGRAPGCEETWGAARPMSCPNQGHEEFEGASQCQGRPRADQGAARPVTEAVRQGGTDGGDDASTEAPPRQWWSGLVPSTGVEHEHARRQDEAVHVKGTSRAARPDSPCELTSS